MTESKTKKMSYDEAIKILRKEKWKASPDTPLPQWLIEKNDPDAIKDFRKTNDLKHEAFDIAIKCVKAMKRIMDVNKKINNDLLEELKDNDTSKET